jgi:uncharacterized protein involved in outer membrane biogenesis
MGERNLMRWKWIVGIGVLVIVILITAVYVYLNTYDYNKIKPLVARMVEDATGRKLSLGGEVSLEIGFAPALVVTNVALTNVSWGSQPQMIEIEKLQAKVRLLPLLFKDVDVTYIRLVGVKVLLETGPKAQGNWNFLAGSNSTGSNGAFKPTAIEVNQVSIENLHLTFRGTGTGSPRQFTIASLVMNRQEKEDALTLKLKADYNGQALALSGKIGRIRDVFAHQRFPLQLSGKLANVAVKINGAIDDVLTVQGIDVEARLSGKNFATLGPVLDIQLPKTKAFDVSGHLKGSGDSLGLDNINGNLSGSSVDIAISGRVDNLIAFSGVDLKLKSSGKDLAAMGPVIGEKLPATDEFEIQGHLTGSSKALTMKNAQASAKSGDLRFTVNGAVKDLLTLRGMDLQSRLTGKDLAEFGVVIGEKLPVTDQFEIQGRLTGSTEALTLQEAKGSARRGSMRLSLTGAVKDLLTLRGMDLQPRLTGKELAEIGPMFGTKLPGLGPFDMRGKLAGSAKAISLNAFSAIIDKSDFKGLVKVEFFKRPKWTIRLESSVIDFTALMKSIEKDEQKTANKDQQKRRLFSDDPLPFDVLKKVDADIVIKAKNVHAKNARFNFGQMTLKLEDSDFSIDEFEATYKQTKISGKLHISHSSPTRAAANFLVQNFDLGSLLKETGKSDQVRAIVDIAAHGKSKGDSVHSLMASLNGSIGAVMGQGYLTKYLDMLSKGLSAKVIPFWRPLKTVDQINCAVVQFDIKEGVATSQAFVFDTRAGILAGTGKINLDTEQIDFLLVPTPAHPDLSLATKLRVSGTVMDPKVSPDELSLLTKGAEFLSSLAVGPLALLAPFVHLGAHKAHPCDIQSIGQLGLQRPASK